MNGREVALVLGGSWHDFPAFAQAAQQTLGAVSVSYELATLESLDRCGVLVLYTCLDDHTSLAHRPAELTALASWVRRGGALVALHSTAVAAQHHPELAELIGGSFVSHPPKRAFEVVPLARAHPITDGVEAFAVEDELYTLDVEDSARLLLITVDSGRARPLAWTRREGTGKVAYLALGHDRSAWDHPAFRRLLAQSVGWARTSGGA